MGVLGPVLLKVLREVFLRGTFALALWLCAPPLLYILFAWLLLHDCDFRLLLQSQVPGNEEQENAYFRDKVCWVTGASSGIGQALAIALAKRGAYVILSARNQTHLEKVAEECQRSYLVSEIRTLNRSESAVTSLMEEVSNVAHTRVLVVPLDMALPAMSNSAVRSAMSWRGRVDMLFNNAGISQRAILAEGPVDEKVMRIDFMGPMILAKSLLTPAMQPAPPVPPTTGPLSPTRPQLRFPHLERMSTAEFKTATRSLGMIVRQLSVDKFHTSARRLRQTAIVHWIRRVVWGYDPSYTRTFHLVNTSSIFARLPTPGRCAYVAAKAAMGCAADVTKMEVEGLFRAGCHQTEFVVTNCLLGPTRTGLLQRVLLTNGEPANDATPRPPEPYQMTPARCAELMLRATYSKVTECWISKQPYLTYVYLQYYAPWLWRYISCRWYEFAEFQKVLAYNEQHQSKK